MDQKYVLKSNLLGKVQSPAGFEAMTYRFVVNALIHCSTLLRTNFGKEKNIKIILDFMVYFYRNYVTGGVPFHLKVVRDTNVDKNIL